MRSVNWSLRVVGLMMGLLLVASCSGINERVAPVELVATIQQDVDTIDILNLPTTDLGTILIQAIQKRQDTTNLPVDTRFLDVQLRRYRVSYRRTDGGNQVPASFARTISGLVTVNGSPQALNSFTVFDVDALNQAPFAALLPQNGGKDPQTGKPFVQMDVIIDIFGETLSGETVSARVSSPFTFCAGCS